MFRWTLTIILLVVNTPRLCCGGCAQPMWETSAVPIPADASACPYCGGSEESDEDSQMPSPCRCQLGDVAALLSDASEGETLLDFQNAVHVSLPSRFAPSQDEVPGGRVKWMDDAGPTFQVLLQRFLL